MQAFISDTLDYSRDDYFNFDTPYQALNFASNYICHEQPGDSFLPCVYRVML